MATVSFDGVWKKFGEVVAVNDLNLEINDGEFMVLVGPSGCARPPRCAWWPASRRSPRAR